MEPIEKYEHAGLTIEIHTDDSPMNPRTEYDNVGKLVIFEGRRSNFAGVDELNGEFKLEDFPNWDEMDTEVLKRYPRAELLPVYRYEHGDVAYNTTGFNDSWDSGRVGFILCTREDVIKEWGKKIATAKAREHARGYLACEVETYSQWANGEVFGYIVKDEHGNDMDDLHESCWGFYGLEYCKTEAQSAAESLAPKWFAGAVSRAAAVLNDALEAAGQQRLIS